jgi:hypothetical protein
MGHGKWAMETPWEMGNGQWQLRNSVHRPLPWPIPTAHDPFSICHVPFTIYHSYPPVRGGTGGGILSAGKRGNNSSRIAR